MSTFLQRLHSLTKKRRVFLKVDIEEGEALQKRTISKLLKKAESTVFGKSNNFKDLIGSDTLLSDYQEATHMGDYLNMLPWWSRGRMG